MISAAFSRVHKGRIILDRCALTVRTPLPPLHKPPPLPARFDPRWLSVTVIVPDSQIRPRNHRRTWWPDRSLLRPLFNRRTESGIPGDRDASQSCAELIEQAPPIMLELFSRLTLVIDSTPWLKIPLLIPTSRLPPFTVMFSRCRLAPSSMWMMRLFQVLSPWMIEAAGETPKIEALARKLRSPRLASGPRSVREYVPVEARWDRYRAACRYWQHEPPPSSCSGRCKRHQRYLQWW